MTYEDRPHNYDAWDVNNYYIEKSWEVDQVEKLDVIENGPVRACIRVERASDIYEDAFSLDVHTSEATFDIQYGNVKRQNLFLQRILSLYVNGI